MTEAVARAAANFSISGEITTVSIFGAGHIHDTYLVESTAGPFLLQKINKLVFQQPALLVSNLNKLSGLVSQKLIVESIRSNSGSFSFEDDQGHWRMQQFMANTSAPEKVSSKDVVTEVAHGFALFNRDCMDLNPEEFEEVIPGFHDLGWRLQQFQESKANASQDRLKRAQSLVQEVDDQVWISEHMNHLWGQDLPLRVCHNDTKSNNILLDSQSGKFKRVIDLDTVGAGSLLYDFGDMMRTMLSPTDESEMTTERIGVNKVFFKSLASAYLGVLGRDLTELERSSLVFGGMYMTYIMAVRFLTDYLNGDVYYKTSFEQQNLVRARNQLVFLAKMSELRSDLECIVDQV